ncbi:hypothetical protein GCM10027051_17250 [Niabella terrae]
MEAAKFIVTPEGLEESSAPRKETGVLRVLAGFFSYLFHPVFVPIYLIAFLLFTEPFLFPGISGREKVLTLGRAFVNYSFFPLISVLLLKGLGLIKSIRLGDRKDRIIPFIICNIWYFWIWYVWRNLPGVPYELVVYALGVFLASSMGLLANIYIKVSMHGLALGTTTLFLCRLCFMPESSNISIYLALSILITGLVGSARLILKEHSLAEYYWGVGLGALAVVCAGFIA